MLVYIQKINIITHFFLRYGKEIVNLLFWIVWACLWSHTSKMIVSIRRNLSCLSTGKKWTYFFYFGYFGHAWLRTPKMILSTCRKLLCLSAGKKINFIPHVFMEILQRYGNFLFWVLWACLDRYIQNDSINLYKTSIFICMAKINFIIHFFLEILHFKESCNLIGQQDFGPLVENQNFARSGIGGEVSVTVLVFILDYFREKLIPKFFKKSKKPYLGAIFGPFFPKFWQKWISPEKGVLSVFKHFIYLSSCKKKKTLMSHSWEKRRTDERIDRQRWFYRRICRPGAQ